MDHQVGDLDAMTNQIVQGGHDLVGHLPADRHEFMLPTRHQSRRVEVRRHRGQIGSWIELRGLPVTRPSRIASDLLTDGEDPDAAGHIIAEAIQRVLDSPGTFADALTPHAAQFGLRRGDGLALPRWLLDLAGDPDTEQ